MNTPKIAPPLPPARAELAYRTLEERIALAEQRLVAREEVLRHRARALLQRAQEATEPRRLVRRAAYALGALALVWGAVRLLGRRRGTTGPGSMAALAAAPAAPPVSRLPDLPWVRAAPLLWPLLPVAWRGRMRPETASVVVAMALPLAGLLFGSRRPRAPQQRRQPE